MSCLFPSTLRVENANDPPSETTPSAPLQERKLEASNAVFASERARAGPPSSPTRIQLDAQAIVSLPLGAGLAMDTAAPMAEPSNFIRNTELFTIAYSCESLIANA